MAADIQSDNRNHRGLSGSDDSAGDVTHAEAQRMALGPDGNLYVTDLTEPISGRSPILMAIPAHKPSALLP